MMMMFISILYRIVKYFPVDHHSSCTWPGVMRFSLSIHQSVPYLSEGVITFNTAL